jgi:hypothetical protein
MRTGDREFGAEMEDIRDTGYWPTTFVSNKSPELPVHYHDIIGYVIEGETHHAGRRREEDPDRTRVTGW